jgi:hypothetical protein
MSDASSTAYLRPETAQGIFVNFKNAQQTSRQKVPFGIAQVEFPYNPTTPNPKPWFPNNLNPTTLNRRP